jgi:hypothetical protein
MIITFIHVVFSVNDRELEEFYRENLDKPENESSCIII